MPFLLCFSYRLYYQYIFIYFSASSSDKEAKPLGNEAAFFCIDISPDFLCPEKGNPLYQQKIQPVLEESGLDQKKITRQTSQGVEILSLLSQMATAFELKSDGYEFDLLSGIFKLWKNLRIYLDPDIRNTTSTEAWNCSQNQTSPFHRLHSAAVSQIKAIIQKNSAE